jgi:hypothetical protein
MIDILNKEWLKYKLLICLTEDNEFVDIVLVKSELNKEEMQICIDMIKDKCEDCTKKDTAVVDCVSCCKKKLEDIIEKMVATNQIEVLDKTIGLTVYKGITI